MIAVGLALFMSVAFAVQTHAATNYVALGDSYAAGFGADTNQYQGEKFWTYDQSTVVNGQNECYRSNNAYARVISDRRGYNLTFAACRGAVADNVLSVAQYPGQPAQIDSVTASTNLVSLQVGGNDANFGGVVQCVVTSNCTESSAAYQASVNALNNVVPAKLDAIYTAIKQRAPSAKILAIDYAPLLPGSFANVALCAPYMTSAELTLAKNFQAQLNAQVKAAADRAGATYVNTDFAGSPFLGRDWVGLSKDLCSTSAGSAGWSIRLLTNGRNVSFHPSQYGQEFYAQIIRSYL